MRRSGFIGSLYVIMTFRLGQTYFTYGRTMRETITNYLRNIYAKS